jgi:hypothetical protein
MGKYEKKKYKFGKSDFDSTKKLLDIIGNKKQVSEITGWSYGTILSASKAKSYEDYRKKLEQRFTTEKQPVGTVSVTGDHKVPELSLNPTPQFDFNLLNENLVLLSNKLEVFRDAVEKLTIATYSLRKSVKVEDGTKKFWR